MIGPQSSSKKPGDEDSWESLAEDLFGIDFHRSESDEDLEDDDVEMTSAPSPIESDDAQDEFDDEDEDEDDLSFDEDELEAGFPEEDEEVPPPPKPKRTQPPREPQRVQSPQRPGPSTKTESDKPKPVADEGDSFWDALNDWDWSEKPPARARRAEPAADEAVEPAAESEESTEAGPAARGRGRRRRGRGRGRAETEHREVAREESPLARLEPVSEPQPLSSFDDEFDDLASSAADDDFGAGLLSPAPRRSGRPSPQRSERASRPTAEPTRPSAQPLSSGDDFGDDLTDEEAPRRRRRRRRRSGEPSEGVSAQPENAFAEPPQEDEFEQPRRRRERTVRSDTVEAGRENRSTVETSRSAFRDVPTWAEAIGLLVHRRPKQTTTWTPDVEESRPRTEREGRPRSSGPNRRRRRRS